MPAKLDLLGQTFGELTAIEVVKYKEVKGVMKKGRYYRCSCSCGSEVIVPSNALSTTVRRCSSHKTNLIRKELEGSIISTKKYGEFKVVKYNSSTDVQVEFVATGHRVSSDLKEVRLGKIKDPTLPTVFGVGYFGIGTYEGVRYTGDGRKKSTPAYEVWSGMLKRCYSQHVPTRQRHCAYNDVTVCEEWHNFQSFAEWYYNNLPKYENPDLDKDLKIIGNKEYNPHACSFVPTQINSLFTGNNEIRDLPRGVHFCNTKKVYVAQLHCGEITANGDKKQSYLGSYFNKEPAIKAYKEAKVKHTKEVANKYKHMLDPVVYDNIINRTLDFI